MRHLQMAPPAPTEYAPYFGKYIAKVGGSDVISALAQQLDPTLAYFRSVPESKEGFRYAPDKWSIRQVLGHIIDTERLFTYRALSFARNDPAALPGMEQEDWMNAASFDDVSLRELTDEFESVRRSTVFFFKHLSQEAWMRKGIASENPFTVRALAYSIAGHELHHLEILRTRY